MGLLAYVIYKEKKYLVEEGKLSLSSEGVKYISEIIGIRKLKNLTHLDLSQNQITKTEGLDSLTNLRILDLTMNRITKIEGLENLKYLEYLYLWNNRITTIEGLDTLNFLQYLNLGMNFIKEIRGLENLEFLKTLVLVNNSIKITQIFLLGESAQSVIGFYKDQIEEGERRDYNFTLRLEYAEREKFPNLIEFTEIIEGFQKLVKILTGDLFEKDTSPVLIKSIKPGSFILMCVISGLIGALTTKIVEKSIKYINTLYKNYKDKRNRLEAREMLDNQGIKSSTFGKHCYNNHLEIEEILEDPNIIPKKIIKTMLKDDPDFDKKLEVLKILKETANWNLEIE